MTESRVLYTLHTHTHTNVQTPPSCCKHQDRGIFFVGLLFSCKCKWAKHCTKVSRKSENLSIVRSLNSVIHVAKNCNNQLKKKTVQTLLQNQIQACLQLFFTTFSPHFHHNSHTLLKFLGKEHGIQYTGLLRKAPVRLQHLHFLWSAVLFHNKSTISSHPGRKPSPPSKHYTAF